MNGIVVKEDHGATSITTSSMAMEVCAITEAFRWIKTKDFSHVLVATDSMSTLEKIRSGHLHADWLQFIRGSHVEKITWIFCPGHCGIRGNERADQLAGGAKLSGDLALDPPSVLLLVKESILSNSTPDTDSFTTALLLEKGVKRGAGRRSDLRGLSRRRCNQMLVETISLHTLRWILERKDEQLWLCAACNDSNSS